ncbi:MAG TPA: AAA family ATPase [Candidatus Dormibacteraeota bacterium]|jgi:ATP-dependent Clp protease ATP-binding subunit ClpC|nr:AAA family ATPase [Candidatus Dormibacteraeota bacterium]
MTTSRKFGYELEFSPDCLRLFAKARELEQLDGITPNTVLRAFWELDLPGSRLLTLVELRRSTLGALLDGEGNTPGTTGNLIYHACRAALDRNAEHLCDSVDLAQQLVLHPWGSLRTYLAQHPLPPQAMERALRELRRGDGHLDSELLQLGRPLAGQEVFGRERELRRLAQILTRTRVRSAVVSGPPGCGKSALLAGLAHRIESGSAARPLRDAPLIQLDVDAVLGIWHRQGKDGLRRGCRAAGESRAILVLPDLRDLEENVRPLGDLLDLADEAGARVVTTADPSVVRQARERSASILARFEELTLEPLDAASCGRVLGRVRGQLERHFRIPTSAEVLDRVPQLAERYVHDPASPANAIRLLDQAFALAAMDGAAAVTLDHVRLAIEDRTGIPVRDVRDEDAEVLLRLEEELGRRVVGQRHAIAAVARTVRRSRAGLRDPNRPIGSFLFAGPSGVGKTEMAKATAEVLFGSEQELLTFDMSEYKEDTVWTLIGSSRGYKMSDLGGTLTEPVRRKPYCVILFDEIDKAHPEILDILLQVMEEGRLTDGTGHRVDFRHTLVVMTTNLAADAVARGGGALGFHAGGEIELDGQPIAADRLDAALRLSLRPEFINRVDEVVAFNPLTRDDLVAIADLQVASVGRRLAERDVALESTPAALRWLADRGYDRAYGARPLRRLVQDRIADPAAELLLRGDLTQGGRLRVHLHDSQLLLQPIAEPPDQGAEVVEVSDQTDLGDVGHELPAEASREGLAET